MGLGPTMTMMTALAMGGMASGTARACEPPMPNVVRLNPFVVQGSATLAAKDRPILPPNVDFSLGVLHVDRVDAGSFRLQRDGADKREPAIPLVAEARGSEVEVRVRAAAPLAPSTGYSVYGALAGKPQRIFQFQTSAAEDRTAPGPVKVERSVHIGRFQAGGGLCDDGHARLILTVASGEGAAGQDNLRYLVEGAGEPQLLTAWCRFVEARLPPGVQGPLRVTAVDLAGNRSPTLSVDRPAPLSGSWDAVQAQRECKPGR
jgi:hypothetical protein